MAAYDCDKCGACCKGTLLVEAFDLDAIREPRLLGADIGTWARGKTHDVLMAELEQDGRCLIIAGGGHACRFLQGDNACGIYPTRPNECVAMEAGDEQCQMAREEVGLPPLEPRPAA